jgi:hypothetical protein
VGTSTVSIVVTQGDIDEQKWLSVFIDAQPLFWKTKLNVDFTGLTDELGGNYTFEWDFWDWQGWVWKNITHWFVDEWMYTVILKVTDSDWNVWDAQVSIKVEASNLCLLDSDWDWVSDCDDDCPAIAWDELNNGCPILEQFCASDCSCWIWYECTSSNTQTCSTKWVCVPERVIINPCLEVWLTWLIYGNAVCSSCPCVWSLDFRSQIRKCDVIFPAITSPDSSIIYSQWEPYVIE